MSKGTGVRILAVDDDPEILAMLDTRLSKRGYRMSTASDGNAALAAARAIPPTSSCSTS